MLDSAALLPGAAQLAAEDRHHECVRMPSFLAHAEWQPGAAEHAACLQAQEQARAQLVAEHEQRAAAAAEEHAAALQQLQQQAAEQRLAGEAAQAAWVAARSALEQAVSKAAAQLEAAQQQSQVQPGTRCLAALGTSSRDEADNHMQRLITTHLLSIVKQGPAACLQAI
jgi:hypothetical protein